MTLLHQAAQKAVEALTAVRYDKSFCCLKEERTQAVVVKALSALESALQQQEVPSGVVIPPAPPECETEDEKTAFAFGYWQGLHAARKGQEVPREPVAWMLEFTDPHTGKRKQEPRKNKPRDYEMLPGELLWPLYASPSTTQQQEAGNWPDEGSTVESIVAELVAGLQRAEAKRKQRLSDLPAGTCETCMGEGYLGSIESQRITDCPDCIGGVRQVVAPSTPESAEKDDAGGGKGAGPVRLWAMHIAGPDDVHAAPGEAEARAAAERFNAWFAQRKDPHPLDPQMHATAIEWPHSAEAHANDLPRWRDFVPPAAGVEGKCECGLSEVACRDPLRRSCPDGVPASRSEPTPPRGNDGGEHA